LNGCKETDSVHLLEQQRNSKLVFLKQTKLKRFEEVDMRCIEGKTKLGENFVTL
jgi:hypothetical protein